LFARHGGGTGGTDANFETRSGLGRDVEFGAESSDSAALCADNNTSAGPAYKALFPDGLDKVKAQARSNFDKAIADFKSAIDSRQAADTKLSQARAAESGAREHFVKAYDSNIGAIRQLFPRDRTQQNPYFDETPPSRASSSGGGGNTPAPPASTSEGKS
jgi:hypothetical protein